jgi:hypothetical protein
MPFMPGNQLLRQDFVVINDFDLKWLLILPALAAAGFMFWVSFDHQKSAANAGSTRDSLCGDGTAGISRINPSVDRRPGPLIAWNFTS